MLCYHREARPSPPTIAETFLPIPRLGLPPILGGSPSIVANVTIAGRSMTLVALETGSVAGGCGVGQ